MEAVQKKFYEYLYDKFLSKNVLLPSSNLFQLTCLQSYDSLPQHLFLFIKSEFVLILAEMQVLGQPLASDEIGCCSKKEILGSEWWTILHLIDTINIGTGFNKSGTAGESKETDQAKKSGEGVLDRSPGDVLAHGKPAWEGSSCGSFKAVVYVDHAVRTPRRLRRVVPAARMGRAAAEGVWLDPAGRPDAGLGGVVHPAAGVSSALLQAARGCCSEGEHGGAGQKEGRADHCDSGGGGGGGEGEGGRCKGE